ncbi:hypothetical protein EYE40_07230 [Glaciihabitans arcticus]|uniref:Uncharacterized protein n=1 Tax=Glaciihabitans arcticus TaxID=2668039 RepID=A0A4Q9GQP3_9MICO|nr:hypothetical protein [Glaciihabitans arcticus]TBN57206.1 hypothetical protein EYE40_07230 [Glaciihabitans arcticus]
MTDVTSRYLKDLAHALADVPRESREEILAGVREELTGLDDAEAAARIAALGDPAVIAAGARSEQPLEPRWRTIVTAILVGIGGIVVPVIGWGVGISLMTGSRAWTRRQKWAVAIAPAVVAGISALFAIAVGTIVGAARKLPEDGVAALFTNTLSVPHLLLIQSVFVLWGTALVTGIWLLVKARR